MKLSVHNFKTLVKSSPIANTKNLLYYYRKLQDNRILFGTRGDFTGSDQSNLDRSKIMQKIFKKYFSKLVKCFYGDYNWRGLIAIMSQKLTPSIGKIENEWKFIMNLDIMELELVLLHGTGKNLSKLVKFSSNSERVKYFKNDIKAFLKNLFSQN